VNVREWVTQRSSQVPETLTKRVIELLGADAEHAADRTGEACLSAATRGLNELLASGRQERESALDLLAIDALTTFAYEHASENGNDAAAIKSLAMNGAKTISNIPTGNG
jgi:uncharacterized membrane protein